MINKNLIKMLVCPVCGSSLETKESEIICQSCSKIYSSIDDIPVITKDSREMLENIKEKVEIKNNCWYADDQAEVADKGPYRHHIKKRIRYVINLIKKYTGNRSLILDMGCGDGVYTKYLEEIPNTEIIACDYNVYRLEKAKKNTQGTIFVAGDVLCQFFKEKTFDIVLLNHIIEHIPDDSKVLAQIHKILKPSGILIIAVPNEGAFLYRMRNKFLQPNMKTDHVHFYTIGKMRSLIKNAGFDIAEMTSLGFEFPYTGIDWRLHRFRVLDDIMTVIGCVFPYLSSHLHFVCRKK
jgi:SAM-dependent methyltransferase